MTVLASRSLQIFSTCSRAVASLVSARSTSMYLPCRTSLTPVKPRLASACWMALPCGSRSPFFSVILMRTLIVVTGSRCHSVGFGTHEHGTAALGARVLGQHAKPARHLLVGLQHAAKVAAEAILVELVGGGGVPQPTAVGTDFVGQHDAHLLVVPQAPELD